jgi:hypothetical protein
MTTLIWGQHKDGYYELTYKGVYMTIEPRPGYCDRGNYVAKITPGPLQIDDADLWPRYYFSLSCAMAECQAFLLKREELGQLKEK